MAPLTISPIVPDGIYRIRSLVRPDLLFEQQTDGEGTVKLATLDESKGSQLWDLSADVLENRYTIFNPGTPCRLGFKVSPGRPWESVPASERFAVPTLWTIEPRHEAFVIGVYGDERVINLSHDEGVIGLSNFDGSKKQRWILDVVSLKSTGTIDEHKTYVIRNFATGKSLLVRSTYGNPSHITSYLDTNRDPPDYLKWQFMKDTVSGAHALRNQRFPSIWAAHAFQIGDKPCGYRFIPVPGGKYFFISPDTTSSPPRVAQDSPSAALDVPMSTASLDKNNALQMWELIAV